MNIRQIIWVWLQLQKLFHEFEIHHDYEKLRLGANEITDKAKGNEYARKIVLDVLEALDVNDRDNKNN